MLFLNRAFFFFQLLRSLTCAGARVFEPKDCLGRCWLQGSSGLGGVGSAAGASQALFPCFTLPATLCLEFLSLLQMRKLGSHTGRRNLAYRSCAARFVPPLLGWKVSG